MWSKGWSLEVEDGGRDGRGLGAMTGRRYSGLKMGSKQKAQSCTTAGVAAGLPTATKTLPRAPHVMERAFRRGPEEASDQGAIASSSGAC